jgi:methylated-DNA-[protein]-cysteine S-methyltransferase
MNMAVIRTTVPFEMGQVLVLSDPDGLVKGLTFEPDTDTVQSLSGTGLVEELARYFRGERVRWSLVPDLSSETGFCRAVYERVMKIPYGKTATYGQVARDVGSPGGARAVGQAMARNRFPVIIPCHRVVSGNGGLGGFSSGLDLKRFLLKLEGHTIGA